MLSKRHRLTRREFDRVFKRGRGSHTPYLQHITLPADDFKAAVVVPKRVAKSAVVRNRLRRQLYDALRRHENQAGHHIFILKPALAVLAGKARAALFLQVGASLRLR